MAIKTINIGNLANDGTGDDLREAFIKVNDNFTEMQIRVDTAVSTEAENIGIGKPLFAQKLGNVLQFKSLLQGSNILLTEYADQMTITADAGLKQIIVLTEAGSVILPGGDQLLNLYGGQNIGTAVETQGQDLFVRINLKGQDLLLQDPDPHLAADLICNDKNITDAYSVSATTFLGNLQGTVYGLDMRELNDRILEFDFGGYVQNLTSIIDYIYLTTDIDFGTFIAPASISLDEGTL